MNKQQVEQIHSESIEIIHNVNLEKDHLFMKQVVFSYSMIELEIIKINIMIIFIVEYKKY